MPTKPAGAAARRERSGRAPGQEQYETSGEVARLDARVAELERDYMRLESFAAIAAHELAEPLVTTEAYTTLLLDRLGSTLDAESRSDLDALSRSACRLRLVVETLLHEARSSQRTLPRQAVALDRLVDDCIALLRHEIRCREARLVLRPLPTVCGDPSLLGVVIKNLLSNALRYGPRRRGVIRIGASRLPAEWRISMVNAGTPIPPQDRHRIFAAFERGSQERRTPGTGLGLAISRNIVERHGGSIGVEPCPRGNRFYFTIPD